MPISYEKSEGIATITIDNPPVNVFTPVLHKELYNILKDFNADSSIRCGILTGAGDRAFCAGDDIKTPRAERSRAETVERYLAPRQEDEPLEYPGWETEIMTMQRYKPIIGAVNGVCVGQGMVYLMHLTDLRYAAPEARFGMPEIAYGMGGAGGALSLGKMMPHVAAMELLLLGEMFSAKKAKRTFLINGVIEKENLLSHAQKVAEKIASHPPIGVRTEMEAYQRSLDMSRADALSYAGNFYRLIRSVQSTVPPLAQKGKE